MYGNRISTWYHLTCLTIILSCARAKMIITMKRIECLNYAPDLMTNVSCYVNQTSGSPGTFSIKFLLTEELNDIKGHFLLSIKRGSIVTEYLSLKVDYCKVLGSMQSHFLARMLTAEMRRVSNIPLECPLKKNKLYYIKEFTVNANMIPRYIPKLDYISEVHINHKNTTFSRTTVNGSLVRS